MTFVDLHQHTPVLSPSEEEQLWESSILGVDTPVKLQHTVFFYVGKVCYLRGGQEQHALKPSQFQRKHDPDRYLYIENGSKNNSGAQLQVTHKVVPVYANPTAGEHCLVYLYLSKLPKMAFEKAI